MKGRAFTLSNKDSTIRSDEMSLNKNKNTLLLQKDITRKTLGAKLQQEGLHFGLAEKEEHPWLRGQLHDPQPLQPSPWWDPLIW